MASQSDRVARWGWMKNSAANRRPSADGFACRTVRPGGPTAGAGPAKEAHCCANTARSLGGICLVMLTSIFIRLVLLPTSMLVSPGLSGAEPVPTPRYYMWNWNSLVGTIPTQFSDPSGLAGEIASVYAKTPQPYWQRLGDSSIGFVVHYCEARAEPFVTQDFLATTPMAVYTSQITALSPIGYTRAMCTAGDRGEVSTYPTARPVSGLGVFTSLTHTPKLATFPPRRTASACQAVQTAAVPWLAAGLGEKLK